MLRVELLVVLPRLPHLAQQVVLELLPALGQPLQQRPAIVRGLYVNRWAALAEDARCSGDDLVGDFADEVSAMLEERWAE